MCDTANLPWKEAGGIERLPHGVVTPLVGISVQHKFGVVPELGLKTGKDLCVCGHVEIRDGFAFPVWQFGFEGNVVVLKHTKANNLFSINMWADGAG